MDRTPDKGHLTKDCRRMCYSNHARVVDLPSLKHTVMRLLEQPLGTQVYDLERPLGTHAYDVERNAGTQAYDLERHWTEGHRVTTADCEWSVEKHRMTSDVADQDQELKQVQLSDPSLS